MPRDYLPGKARRKYAVGIKFVEKRRTKEQVLSLMHPLIRDWFNSRFKEMTEPQALAIPLIHTQENALISSPTGSGKTLTAFLSIINELWGLQEKGKLENHIYALYISPLKALANDISKNLLEPLKELEELAGKEIGFDVEAWRRWLNENSGSLVPIPFTRRID